MATNIRSQLTKTLICVLRIYQYMLSSLLGSCCRFSPSCSHYAIEALETHGFIKGAYLSLRRVLRCQPWHPGGIDLVPVHKKST